MPLKRQKAPEPILEEIRFQKFKDVVEKALDEASKTLTVEKLESCYPNIAKTFTGKKYLELSQKQIYEFWRNESKKEFELIYKERDLELKLTQLDNLIYEAEVLKFNKDTKSKIFPDKLTPEDIINGKLAVIKELKIKEYELQLRSLQEDNESQVGILRSLLNESNELIEHIETSIGDHFSGIDKEADNYEEVNQNIKKLLHHLEEI